MLNKSKRRKLQKALRAHQKEHFSPKRSQALGESDTRQVIDDLLKEVLGYALIDEAISEYEKDGLKADYLIKLKGKDRFLIEAKSFSTELKLKHLNQATQYAAHLGVEWVLLSNGRHYELHKITCSSPLTSRRVFGIDLTSSQRLEESIDALQYLHKISIAAKGLDLLWKKTIALDSTNVAGLLYAPTVLNYLKRTLKAKYKRKFSDGELIIALDRVIAEKVDLDEVNPVRVKKNKRSRKATEGLTTPLAAVVSDSPVVD